MAAEILKLQSIQCKYENELQTVLSNVNTLEGENYFSVVPKETNSRNRDQSCFQTDIKVVDRLLKEIKCNLFNGNLNNETNPKEIKTRMIKIQEIILDIRKKEMSVLQDLKAEEDFLKQDYKEIIIDDWITQWSRPNNFETFGGKKKIKCNHSCKEVNDFFEFLTKSGGNTNGWSENDHKIFLKTRSTVKSQQNFVAVLHRKLTNKTEYEIERHMEWYSQYSLLKNKKLDAVRNWKCGRKLNNAISPLSESTEIHDLKIFHKNSRMKINEKLTDWKKEKEDKKLQQLHMKKSLRQQIFERERLKENERKVIKKEVDNWKFAKIYNEQLEREQKELLKKLDKKYREREANNKIKSFQAKDDNYLQKKLIIRQRSRSVEIHKPKKEAPRDPNRLLKPTKQWLNRQITAKQVTSAPSSIPYINHISRLAIPEWRKSLG